MAVFDIRLGDSAKLLGAGVVLGILGAWFFLSDLRLRGVPTNVPGVMSAGQGELEAYQGEYESSYGEIGPVGSPDNQLRYQPPPPYTVAPQAVSVSPYQSGSSFTQAGSPDNQIRYIPPIASGGELPFGLNQNPEGIQARGAMWNTIGGFPAWSARDKVPVPVEARVLVQADNIHWS